MLENNSSDNNSTEISYLKQQNSNKNQENSQQNDESYWQRKKICTLINLKTKPQKLLAIQKIYLLKNGFILDEDQITMMFQGKAQNLDSVQGLLGQFNHFKCIKNIQVNYKKGFTSQNFQDYNQDHMSTQYLVQRFQSFNDQKYKQLADLVQTLEDQYEYFNNCKKQFEENEKKLKQNLSDIDYEQNLIKQKFDLFKDNPTFILHFKAGINGKLFDLQSANQNLLACQLVGIDVQNISSVKNLYDKCIPDGMVVIDKQKFLETFVNKIMFKNYLLDAKLEHQSIKVGPDLIQWYTRKGTLIKRNMQFRVFQENMHLFLVIVYDNE